MKHRLKLRTSESPRKGVVDFTEKIDEEYISHLLSKVERCAYTNNMTIKEVEQRVRVWNQERMKSWEEIRYYQTAVARSLDSRDADMKDLANLPAKDWDGNKQLVSLREMLRSLQIYHNYEVLSFLVYHKELLKMKKDIEQ